VRQHGTGERVTGERVTGERVTGACHVSGLRSGFTNLSRFRLALLRHVCSLGHACCFNR